MRSGRKRARCVFQRRGAETDRLGNPQGWASVFSVRGHYIPALGNERPEAGRLEETHRAELEISSSLAAQSLTPADRVIVDGVAHQILSIIDRDQRGRDLVMTLERNAALS